MRGERFLGRSVSLGHVLVLNAATLVVAGVLVVGAAVAGAGSVIDSFRPVGNFRMASSSTTTSTLVEGADGPTTVLSVTFDVPSGKRADILVFYNGQLTKATTSTVGLCFGSVHLDNPGSTALAPGEQLLLDGGVAASGGAVHGEAASLQARKQGVTPGHHTLYFVAETGGVGCYYDNNALFVVANVRNA
jgi:hypothetical protein